MTSALPRTTREIRVTGTVEGLPSPENFAVAEVPLPEPGPGQLLVRNRYFLVFPGLRTLMGTETDDVPLPPLRDGDTLFGPAVGEVVDRPGELVMHMRGWREYAVLDAAEYRPLDGTLPDPAAYLSQGSSAYGALTRLGDLRPDDTVLVTGAAGAVGTMAGQIARLLGAGTVIGTTGSSAKAERLTAELGYDAVVLRSADSMAERFAEAAPDGFDVVLDTVGGPQLVAALEIARPGARFALVGALSGQLSPGGGGGTAPVEIDTFRLLVKGISLRGYAGDQHPDVEQEWTERFGEWLRADRIHFPHTLIKGIDRAPEALPGLLGGRYFGAAIVEV